MQTLLGWTMLVFGGMLYLAQVISSLSFPLAQKIGIQEKAETADALLLRSERYAAYWDLLTLIWFPLAGFLMILDFRFWPVAALAGGAIYLDTAGREAVKTLSFRHEGLKTGGELEKKVFFATYIMMGVLAGVVIVYSIIPLSRAV